MTNQKSKSQKQALSRHMRIVVVIAVILCLYVGYRIQLSNQQTDGEFRYSPNPYPSGYYNPSNNPQSDGYFERAQGGYIGSDGYDSYYYDSSSGCSVIPGSGVSC